MKFLHGCLSALILLFTTTGHAQTYLATRGNEQLLKDSTLFTMQDQVDYRVIGVSKEDTILIETALLGPVAFPNAKRFRVLNGGTYAPDLTVTLANSSAVFVDDPGRPKSTYMHGGLPTGDDWGRKAFCGARYEALLISPKDLVHVFVAFQWYDNGNPVGTSVQTIGKVNAKELKNVSLQLPLESSYSSGKYSIHVYTGYYEIKNTEIKLSDVPQKPASAPTPW